MSKVDDARKNPQEQLWDELHDARAVMLGSPDPQQHMQPMAPQAAPDENAVWFFTRKSSDLTKASAAGGSAHLCLVADDHDYHACLHGKLEVVHSKPHIDRFWSPIVAAWFEGGKDDPDLTMLRYTPQTAAIWASTDSALKFGWEIAKANLNDGKPDLGFETQINF